MLEPLWKATTSSAVRARVGCHEMHQFTRFSSSTGTQMCMCMTGSGLGSVGGMVWNGMWNWVMRQ
jgi:hypothetical protein